MFCAGGPVRSLTSMEQRLTALQGLHIIRKFERQVSLRTRLPSPNLWWSEATVAGRIRRVRGKADRAALIEQVSDTCIQPGRIHESFRQI